MRKPISIKVKIKCENCDKEFLIPHCRVGKRKNCSKKCQQELRHKNRKIYRCYKCGKEISEGCTSCARCWKLDRVGNRLGTTSTYKGEKHWNWKGGIKDYGERYTRKYKAWRKSVLVRDDYRCQHCWEKGDKYTLNAHHIKPFKDYPDYRYDLDNGVTLCLTCHTRVHLLNFLYKNVPSINILEAYGRK